MSLLGSFFQDTGLSIVAREPLWVGSGVVDDRLAVKADQYDHELAAEGGFRAMSLTIRDNVEAVEDWFSHGLGRLMEVRNAGHDWVWEGFANEVSAGVSVLSARRGPLIEVVNKVRTAYRTISYNTNPPIGGHPAVTDWAEDADSQARFAIQEEILTGGEMTATAATRLRDTHLAERAWPETTNDLDLGSAKEAVVRLDCVGFARLTERFSYNQTASAGAENASTKIQNVLAADPNGLFTNFRYLVENTAPVGRYENENRLASAIIEETVEQGDANADRWTFGVYANRVPVYAPVPSEVEYTQRLRAPTLQLERRGGDLVYPWDIRPARWAHISDFLIGTRAPAGLRRDLRNVFLESVRFMAPWNVQLNGGKVNRMDQLRARAG